MQLLTQHPPDASPAAAGDGSTYASHCKTAPAPWSISSPGQGLLSCAACSLVKPCCASPVARASASGCCCYCPPIGPAQHHAHCMDLLPTRLLISPSPPSPRLQVLPATSLQHCARPPSPPQPQTAEGQAASHNRRRQQQQQRKPVKGRQQQQGRRRRLQQQQQQRQGRQPHRLQLPARPSLLKAPLPPMPP